MRQKIFTTGILVIITGIIIVSAAPAVAGEGLAVEYMCGETEERARSIRPSINIVNESGSTVELADIKLRYYYTKEGLPEQKLEFFYTAVDEDNIYADFHPDKGFVEIGFKEEADNIVHGGESGKIELVLEKLSEGYYDQSDDYSFDPEIDEYTEYENITLYHQDELVWGEEGPRPPSDPVLPPSDDDWLDVEGSQIVDKDGEPVYLTGINWFGYETTGANGFYGLDKCSLTESLDMLAELGFNLIRIPVSADLILEWEEGKDEEPSFLSTEENPQLDGYTNLQVLDYTIDYLKTIGIKVMFDMHSVTRGSYEENLWYNDEISFEELIEAWRWLVERYEGDDTVIAADLKNEPHGVPAEEDFAKWDNSEDSNNWKQAAEEIAEEILAVNPELLIVVEGVESYPMDGYDYSNCDKFTTHFNWWGGNLRGVKDHPLDISQPEKVVYSAHEYGPDIHLQPWFDKDFDEDTLYEDCWYPNWYYIEEEDIAPVLIGEWGGKLENADNERWFEAFANFVSDVDLHHTFWSFNPNSDDTGGLMKEDWKTLEEEKFELIEPTLWEESLDSVVPLGGPVPEEISYGDLNGDGDITSADTALMINFILGVIEEFSVDNGRERADLNGDGVCDSIDFKILIDYLLGKEVEFPMN